MAQEIVSPKIYTKDEYIKTIERLMEDGGPLDRLTERRYAQSRLPEEQRTPLKNMPEAQECLEILMEIKEMDTYRGARTFDNIKEFLKPGQSPDASFFFAWTFRDIFTSETRTYGEKETHIGRICRNIVLNELKNSMKKGNIDFYFFDACHQAVSEVYRQYSVSEKKRTETNPEA